LKSNLFTKLLFVILFLSSLYGNNKDLLQSQPEILFNYDKLKDYQKKLYLEVEFNKAILLLNKEQYKEAIKILEKTVEFLEIPSYLNIGIAYYKMGLIDKSVIYLNKIYTNKKSKKSNVYSFMSSAFYLYKISGDDKYLDSIVNNSKRFKNLSEHTKRMLADTYIILKQYDKAIKVLESMEFSLDLKKGMLYLKINNYEKAEIYLKKAKENTANVDTLNNILWMLVYRDLKTNDLEKLKENLDEINDRKSIFSANLKLPLELYFNKNKYSSEEYLDFLTNLKGNRKEDFMYYFAPFIFSDKFEIIYDSLKGFIFSSKDSLSSLEEMVKYNSGFIDIIKDDPIIRVNKLKSLIKPNTRSYVYYNLALSYAQINDFQNAYKYFEKAFRLNPGNKLYASMMLITAKRIDKKIKDEEYIVSNIKSSKGLYKYFGKTLYKLFVNETYSIKDEPLNYKKTVFYKSLDYLDKLSKNGDLNDHVLLKEYEKDPLIFLINFIQRKKNEADFTYFSRLQDTLPLSLNNNFIDTSLIVTKYYIDLLKALGLFHKADIVIAGNSKPSYLRTKAYKDLHFNKSDETIKILEYLQSEYNLENRYDMFLMVAALLDAGRYNDASIQISLIKAILNDSDADFLTGVQLIQELKISSAKLFIKKPYLDSLIDFKLVGFDEFLESL
jgi:tetratricopeptide (TPR) repeat protein